MTEKKPHNAFRALWIFYLLIAFEIVYMITPFGLYYYSVYGKGLNFLNNSPVTSWLAGFFLPHFAKTSNLVLNVYKAVGWSLAIAGFFAFCIGAGQIYYSKLAKKQAVTGGIYNFIRHPQYVSLSICSFGLLLVWPRYIVLIMFITMLFAYYFLAQAEEKECEAKFGRSYEEYMNRTRMFLPFTLPFSTALHLPASGMKRHVTILAMYLIIITASLGLANLLKAYSINNLYTLYSAGSATISLDKIEKDRLEKIIEIALKDGNVQKMLPAAINDRGGKFLNYVLPADWFFPDIPMKDARNIGEHYSPNDYDRDLFKILFMRAILKQGSTDPEGKALILNTVKRKPIIEVEVSLNQNRVVRIDNPSPTVIWGDIPTPLF